MTDLDVLSRQLFRRNAAKGLSTAELDDEEGDVDVEPGT